MTGDTHRELLDYLFGLELHGIKLGLDNITALLDEIGNPHLTYPTVHVAGTNGKGSTVAILDAILRAAGYTVGRFTSPHLIHVAERYLINGVPIADDAMDKHLCVLRAASEARSLSPTFFEMSTAIALRHFATEGVDIALVEVGMGGRFDATNVLHPEVCAVTTIDLEHTRFLGDTLEAIAFEKAGIFKQDRPVVIGETKPGPRKVIEDRACDLGCSMRRVDEEYSYSIAGDPLGQRFSYNGQVFQFQDAPLALSGRYQGPNAAVAVALAETLSFQFERIDGDAVRRGLATAKWPCRLETVLTQPRVIIDVAHNEAGICALTDAVDRAVVVMAVSSDKDASAMLNAIRPIASKLILTEFDGRRARPVAELSDLAADIPHKTVPSIAEAIAHGIESATADTPLLITGSIFAAGEARQILADVYGAIPLQF